jgi:hypothetical protein
VTVNAGGDITTVPATTAGATSGPSVRWRLEHI